MGASLITVWCLFLFGVFLNKTPCKCNIQTVTSIRIMNWIFKWSSKVSALNGSKQSFKSDYWGVVLFFCPMHGQGVSCVKRNMWRRHRGSALSRNLWRLEEVPHMYIYFAIPTIPLGGIAPSNSWKNSYWQNGISGYSGYSLWTVKIEAAHLQRLLLDHHGPTIPTTPVPSVAVFSSSSDLAAA